MATLEEVVIAVGFDVDKSKLEQADHSVGGLIAGARRLASAVAAAFAVDQVVSFITDIAKVTDEIGDTAERLGVTTDALQALGYAAERSGSSAEALQSSMQILGRNVGQALQGGAIAGQFRSLGVAFKDAQGNALPLDQVLQNVAERASQAESPAERMAIATRLLGRGAASLGPLLARGADGIRELREQFVANGGGFTEEGIAAGGEFADIMLDAQVRMNSFKSAIIVGVMPAVRALRDGFMRFWDVAQRIANSHLLQTALAVIAVAFVQLQAASIRAAVATFIAWLPAIASFIGIALVVTALALVFDDLITFVQGGDSVIGRFVDSLYGVGASADATRDLRQMFSEIWDSVTALISSSDELWAGLVSGAEAAAEAIGVVMNPLGAVFDAMRSAGLIGPATGSAAGGVADPANPARILGAQRRPGQIVADTGSTELRAAQSAATTIGGSATVNSATTVNISGAQDPAAVGAQVGETMRRRDREMRRAQEELTPRQRRA